MDTSWYRDFFHGIALDLWRQAVSPEQIRMEASFLEEALELRPGARLLDVPCGAGRHAIELASRGYRVTGVDLSREQIDEARKGAAAAGLEAEWRHADMRDLPWESEFDGAFCLGNSFGYLDPEGTRAFVGALARTLRPGARFALDYGLAAECILPRFKEREWARMGDILFLEENRYDVARSLVETDYTFVRDGQSETRSGAQWVYTVRELGRLLAEAGLHPREVLGSARGEPFAIGSPSLVVVSEKR